MLQLMAAIQATNVFAVLVASGQMKMVSAKALVQQPFLDALAVALVDIAPPAQTDFELWTANVALPVATLRTAIKKGVQVTQKLP